MTNVYIYDHLLSGPRFQKTLERLETRLTDLGLSGKIYRLGPMTRVNEIVRDEIRKQAKTITVVGGDALITKVAGLMAGCDIPLAIIPLEKESSCALSLGISLESACRILAARRIVRIDLGQTNTGAIFLSEISFAMRNPQLRIDGGIVASTEGQAEVQIVNVLPDEYGYRGSRPSPEDGRLNAYILKTESGFLKKGISQSSIVCREIEFLSGPCDGVIDGQSTVEKVSKVGLIPKALSVIVGKERNF